MIKDILMFSIGLGVVFSLLHYPDANIEKRSVNNQPISIVEEFPVKIVKDTPSEEHIITLNAKSWEYDVKEIRIKKGDKLTIRINNTDTMHGIAIPDMKLVRDYEIEVDTSKTGEFVYRCANYCGIYHEDMIGKIIIS